MFYSYVPKYGDLDYLYEKYIRSKPNTKLNFFFDVKNGIYNKDDNIQESNKLDHATEFISGVINVIKYIRNRFSTFENINDRLKFYFFCETGKSSYHRGIDINYKSNRDINEALMRSDKDELFSQTIFFSINVLNEIINMIPNSYFFLGEYREYDYIPYVIYKKVFTKDDVGIIFSTDKDMYQMQMYTNQFEQLEKLTYQSEWHPGRLYINRENYIERLLAKDNIELTPDLRNFISNNFSLLRAIVGDSGDAINGVKGLGYKTFLKLYSKFNLGEVIISRDIYNENLKSIDFFKFDFKRENVIFDLEKIKNMEKEMKSSKKLKDLFDTDNIERICKNLCLMDYDIMYNRRLNKDKEHIDSILLNDRKIKTQIEAQKLIDDTGLWNEHSYWKVSIDI